MLLLPLSFQELRGTDALGAGLLLVAQGVGTLVSRTLAGRLNDRVGPRVVAVVGFAVLGLATLPFAFADRARRPGGWSSCCWSAAWAWVR